MPLPILAEALVKGGDSFQYLTNILKFLTCAFFIVILKRYFGGASNTSERLLHSKVIMMTGGTSGIGAVLARSLASRGAQIILLTQQSPRDPFVNDYIEDLRTETSNELIYAEQVDLASLHSIRVFATKWIDNTPPRRLDMVILCAATMTPRFARPIYTRDGLEPCWGINYLANFHLLSILSPALRAQPAERDVRIVLGTCANYVGGDLIGIQDTKTPLPKGKEYETSKLALMVFGNAFQRHLDTYNRPDKQPNNVRVVFVDPGLVRTPGMRRWLSFGSLLGLFLYLLTWPLWWLVLKSPEMGAQGFLRASMEAELGRGVGGRLLKECREFPLKRPEIGDEKAAKELWQFSEKQIVALEKEGAVRRLLAKKGTAEKPKQQAVDAGKEKSNVNREVPTGSQPRETNVGSSTAVSGGMQGTNRSPQAPT